jgi:hypothetical protein
MADTSDSPSRDILPYDFCLPIDLSKLENNRMKLVPFEVSFVPGMVSIASLFRRLRRESGPF